MGHRIREGLVSVAYGYGLPLKRIAVVEGNHPEPDANGEQNAHAIVNLLQSLGEEDLVLSCISGGGSTLLPAPVKGIALARYAISHSNAHQRGGRHIRYQDCQKASIELKVGDLMNFAYPAFVINLMLSDVVGDDPGTIASGPFSPDSSTSGQAWSILDHFSLTQKVPAAIPQHVLDIINSKIRETPKGRDAIFKGLRVIAYLTK